MTYPTPRVSEVSHARDIPAAKAKPRVRKMTHARGESRALTAAARGQKEKGEEEAVNLAKACATHRHTSLSRLHARDPHCDGAFFVRRTWLLIAFVSEVHACGALVDVKLFVVMERGFGRNNVCRLL